LHFWPPEKQELEPLCVDDHPNHRDIMSLIHAHDVRLTRVEVQQAAIAGEQHEQSERLGRVEGMMVDVYKAVGELRSIVANMTGRQQIILWVVVVGIPAIMGLEIWGRLH
jgi:hypothetical protein